MLRFDAAIFDLDGTLIDSERLVIDAAMLTLRAWGYAVDRGFMADLVGVAEAEGHRRLCAHIGAEIDYAAFNTDWTVAIRSAYAAGIPPMAGVSALLADLAMQGVPVAVATNSGTAGARRKLVEAGLAQHFAPAHVVGYDLVARPKPAPDVFLEAARRLGVAPERCVAFEDSATGVAAALAAGMRVVHVPDMAKTDSSPAHHLAGSILDGALACGLIG